MHVRVLRAFAFIFTVWIGFLANRASAEDAGGFSQQQKLVALPFKKQIEQFERIANQIVIDGQGDDWKGIPTRSDIEGDAGGKATRDILSVRMAPRENDLLLLIATAVSKGDVARRFRIRMDAWQDRTDDFAIDLGEDHSAWLSAPGPDGVWKSCAIQGIERKTDQVTEVRISLTVLAAGLKELGGKYDTSRRSRQCASSLLQAADLDRNF